MGKKGRKFIDKKTDVIYKFKVVSRSQQDPLIADETAPQAVLVEDETSPKQNEQVFGVYFDDDYNYLKHLRSVHEGINWNNEELKVYEIRAEDPQANKKELRKNRINFPSSVFESYVEEPIGLLNRAAPTPGPHPELDPDVVAHLDDDNINFMNESDVCGADNILTMLSKSGKEEEEWEDVDDDDIWAKFRHGDEAIDDEMPPLEEEYNAIDRMHYVKVIKDSDVDDDQNIGTIVEEDEDEEEDSNSNSNDSDDDTHSEAEAEKDFSSDFNDSDDDDDNNSEKCNNFRSIDGPAVTFKDEEVKSHFTEYSLSCSVLKRNDLLTQLDKQFEDVYTKQYGDEQIGALDGEDTDGYLDITSPQFQQALKGSMKHETPIEPEKQEKQRIVDWIKDMECKRARGEIRDEYEMVEVEDDSEDKFDCQSILSTYSNKRNHPKVLSLPAAKKKIPIHPVTGIPMDLGIRRLTKKALANHEDSPSDNDIETESILTSISALSFRPPGETPEERVLRKKAVKELRRERRCEKKANREMFKLEKFRLDKNSRQCKKVHVV